MRILCLTNFYPPLEVGGEEQSCYDVVQALRARGHVVAVLTSSHRASEAPASEEGIFRRLHLEMELDSPWHAWRFFVRRKQLGRANLVHLRQAVAELAPDILFAWGLWNLPRSLPAEAERLLPGRVLYRFADYWPTLPSQHHLYWQQPGKHPATRVLKRMIGRLAMGLLARDGPPHALQYEHAYCISAAMRQELVHRGIPVAHARIIHNGVDAGLFHPDPRPTGEESRLALLYAGRIVPEKGVHTAIEAIALLARRQPEVNVHLTLVGSASLDYREHLRRTISRDRLEPWVSLRGQVPKSEMPALLREHDVLIFPSIWPEPFGRSLIEAMASGLVVLCTPVGGVPEIVTDGKDGLFFPPEDAAALAGRIAQLARDPALRGRLAEAGRRTVETRFSLAAMIDRVESYLQEIVTI